MELKISHWEKQLTKAIIYSIKKSLEAVSYPYENECYITWLLWDKAH